jgi:hypothetical protein
MPQLPSAEVGHRAHNAPTKTWPEPVMLPAAQADSMRA